MGARKTYETDSYAKTLDTNVLKAFEDKGRCCVVLGDTILYPEGGGQPSDRGRVGRANVLDVVHLGIEVIHIVDCALELGPATVQLDWPRRFDHMQQHTGQHLLTAVAGGRFGWVTTAFHLGPELCDIELSAPKITHQQRQDLEDAVTGEIMTARSVTASWVSQEEYKALGVRSRGLPEGHRGDVRLVKIDGLDVNTCGGTHLASTSELGCAKMIGTEPAPGGTRLFFVFGKRVLGRLEAHEQRNHALRTLLGCPDDGLVAAVEQRLSLEKEMERTLRSADDELAAMYAKSLTAEAGVLLARHFENKDTAFLQKVIRPLLDVDAGRMLFLTAEKDGGAFFALAAGSDCDADVPKLGREIAAILGGKGGGSGGRFQGKFTDLGKLGDARAALEVAAKGYNGAMRGLHANRAMEDRRSERWLF
jgi:Ser-tRNA(Ala) deacylase AlaX